MGLGWQQAFSFLVETIFLIYILAVFLRLVFQIVRIDFYNPLAQFIIKITNPLLKPLRKIIPGYWGVDFAAVVLIILLEFIKILLICLFGFGLFPNIIGWITWAIGDLLAFVLQFYFFVVLIRVILSWVAPHQHSYFTAIVYKISDPVLRPLRKVLPLMSGFDFSPLLMAIILQFITLLIAYPIIAQGKLMVFL